MLKFLIPVCASIALLGAAGAAAASPTVSLILHNQGAASVTTTDNNSIWSTSPKTVTAAGTGTGQKNFGSGNVYDTVTINDTLSNAYCTISTQSVYSSYYGHYQIQSSTPYITQVNYRREQQNGDVHSILHL